MALFEARVDTMAKFGFFVTTAADLVEVLKKEFSPGPRYFFGQPGAGGQLYCGVAERAG